MVSVGIITIHKIKNYGSLFQAFALQSICKTLGYKVEIIDYTFPNSFHLNRYGEQRRKSGECQFIKYLFGLSLYRQHKTMESFVRDRMILSPMQYHHPDELYDNPPKYDIYLTGSDQLWNPIHTYGDPAYMLHFAEENARKISYAASIATCIPETMKDTFQILLSKYDSISVREKSSAEQIFDVVGVRPSVVLDPTLLLTSVDWERISCKKRLVKRKYILCYFLNYSFDAFPYVDKLADYFHQQTGYQIVKVARPPKSLINKGTSYRIGASPEEFLALIRDAEIVLTTSFHGTAFAINYGKPLLTIVESKDSSDTRQSDLMMELGLEKQIVALSESFPTINDAYYDADQVRNSLGNLRSQSMSYLIQALKFDEA